MGCIWRIREHNSSEPETVFDIFIVRQSQGLGNVKNVLKYAAAVEPDAKYDHDHDQSANQDHDMTGIWI